MNSFGIQLKNVVCVVIDNEPTTNSAGDLFEERYNIPWEGCIVHLMETITGIIVEHADLNATIKKAKSIITHFSESSQSQRKLINIQ